MNVLLDHCVPRRFKSLLDGHDVSTTFEAGWAAFSNGNLLAKAKESFDVFLTVDQNIQFQQNLMTLPLPIIIIVSANNRFESVAPYAETVLRVLQEPLAKELIRIESPEKIIRLPERPLEP